MAIRAAFRLLLPSLLLAFTLPSSGQAQTPKGELPLAPSVPDSEATQVFVLGTPHLSEMADRFEPSMVDSLVAALDAFGPDAIAIENVSGRQAAAMERWGGRWTMVADRFAGTFIYYGQRIQEETGWSWSEANQRADSLLTVARSAEDDVTPSDRVQLIQSLTASYRLPSATLQWAYYRSDASSAPESLPDTVVTALNERLGAAGEVYSIGLRLAREHGHQRLYPIDHQAEKDLAVPIFRPLMKVIGDSMGTALDSDPVLQRVDSLEAAGLENGELLPMYRYLNRDVVGRADADIQWRTMLTVDLPNDIGRKWLALWEARNLHMVGHIRRVTSQHPGGRVLVIVGSSHKPFFDAYLRQMMGVKVVDAQDVLRGG